MQAPMPPYRRRRRRRANTRQTSVDCRLFLHMNVFRTLAHKTIHKLICRQFDSETPFPPAQTRKLHDLIRLDEWQHASTFLLWIFLNDSKLLLLYYCTTYMMNACAYRYGAAIRICGFVYCVLYTVFLFAQVCYLY